MTNCGCVARPAVLYQPTFPAPGWAEQDPALWLAALEAGHCRRARQSRAGAVRRQGHCHCRPARRLRRGRRQTARRWRRASSGWTGGHRQRSPASIRTSSASAPASSSMPPIWRPRSAGQARNLPEARRVARWHQPVSFVVAALCGRAVIDHALASTTMLYGLKERGYAGDLLAAFDIDADKLPGIDDASAVAGTSTAAGAELTGLPAGTPLAVGTGDDFSAAIGAGVVVPGVVACNLGTAEVVGAVSDTLRLDPGGLVETHGFLGDRYFIDNPGWLSGGAVDLVPVHLRRRFAGGDVGTGGDGGCRQRRSAVPAGAVRRHGAALDRRGAWRLLRPDILPRQSGLRPRGAGRLRLRHARCGRPAGRARHRRPDASGCPAVAPAAGSGRRSAPMSAAGRSEIAGAADASPIGAAILAATAIGLTSSVQQAAERLAGGIETIDPDPAAKAAYDRSYRRYRTLFDALTPLHAD